MLILGEGPVPCRLLFVAEAPGKVEELKGRPMVGPSGQLFDRLLRDEAGLRREDVYVTNLYKRRPPDNRDPTADELRAHEAVLLREWMEADPQLIVAVGRLSARYFLGDVDLESCHGILHSVKGGGLQDVLPVYHPAAGLHSAEMLKYVAYDFRQIRSYLEGRLTPWIKDPGTRHRRLEGPALGRELERHGWGWPDIPF